MAVPISNVTRRQVYAPSGAGGAGPYAFTFEILANTDIAVYKDDVLLTLTTHYTVVINANGTGSVTITAAGLALAPASPTQYAIVGNRTISRTTDFTTGGDFFANVLNDELDQQTIFAQQNAEGLQRALQAPQTDPTSINMTLPRASDRANKTLNFDANGNPIAGLTVTANAAANVATWLGTPSSANLRAAMTDETGTGALVFADAPTFSGNPIFSAGTANGVAYLNGSKVLTTGSALTFDGTNLKTTGSVLAGGAVPSSGAGVTLAYNGSTTGYIYSYDWVASAYKTLNIAGGTIDLSAANNTQITFGVNGSEQMRLTSTGLGIGTSSPAYKLDVNGDAQIGNATAGTNRTLRINGVVNKASRIAFQESGTDRWLIGNGAASENGNFEIYDATNGNNFVLTRAGNLGLGVTPSAWASYKALQVGSGFAAWSTGTTNARIFANTYYDGAYKYVGTGRATQYEQDGYHAWYTAASGTAGNAITFTQAMTLDASGNLLVGTTSALTSASGRGNVTINGTDAVLAFGNSNSSAGYVYAASTNLEISAASTRYINFLTNGSERARITSGGNLLVGTTSFSFSSNGVQIGADGRVWNTSNIDYNFELAGSTGNRIRFYTSAGGSGATVGSITVSTTATAYNTSSDYRLKDNAQPLTGSGAFIDALQPKTWDWKDGGGKGVGFIAHEVQEISPGSVVGAKDAVDAEGNPVMQAMEYGSAEFIANIVAELQSLRARVAQLESKGA